MSHAGELAVVIAHNEAGGYRRRCLFRCLRERGKMGNIVGGTTDGNRLGAGILFYHMDFGHLGRELLQPECALDRLSETRVKWIGAAAMSAQLIRVLLAIWMLIGVVAIGVVVAAIMVSYVLN
jgi:hypothetical protein